MRLLLASLACLPVAACSSTSETPKPSLVVACQTPPPSTSKPTATCGGICVPHPTCSDAAVTCPAGYKGGALNACSEDAECCEPIDAGVDAAPADAAPDVSAADARDA
jgi:hypothetical protein